MKAAKSSVWDLYNGAKQYVVPLFQRPYVWSKEQWDQLWSDICEQYSLKISSDKPVPDRFLGSIVVVREYQKNLDKFTIIDGQQRITTISILLAVIRAFAKERGMTELYEQIADFLKNTSKTGESKYVVIPTRVDKDALYHIIDQDYTFEYDSRIVECFDNFWRRVDESGLDLNLLQQVITEDLCVVYIELDQGENPNQVFEALNYRGVPLEESDLIRNFFFANLESPEIAEAEYDQYWKPMEERFENSQELLSRFLRYFCMRKGDIVHPGEMFETIRRRYVTAAPEEIRNLLHDISRYSDYYLQLILPDQAGEPVENELIQRHIRRLSVLDATAAHPFLMNCLSLNDEKYGGKHLSDEALCRIFAIVETYLIRRTICGRSADQYEEVFSEILRSQKEVSPENLSSGISSLDPSLQPPDDEEFEDHLRYADLFNPEGVNAVTFLVLNALEEYFADQSRNNGRGPELDLFDDEPAPLMIDHIMPVQMSDWWRYHLGNDADTVHQDYLHRLGNLTLTRENPAVLNADFETKKAWYSMDHLMLNSSMRSVRFWRRFQIDQRSGVLAAFCMKIWPSFLEVQEQVQGPDACFRAGEIPRRFKPVLVTIKGVEYPVRFWYQVLESTITAIFTQENQKFERIVREFHTCFSTDLNEFKSVIGEYSYKSRFGRYQIRDMCLSMIRLVGWSDESWCLVCE